MAQLTVRMDKKELEELDMLVKKEGLETRSELIRRAWTAYRTIKKAESNGNVVITMPAKDAIKTPMMLAF